MRIAVLGTGMVAHTLGGAWKKAGHDVVLGARDVADDPDFQVLTLQEAIVTGELVVNAITGSAALEAITGLDTSAMAGKTLLDATNALTETNELLYPNSSLAERLQAALPDVRVVKSLNTAAIQVMADPTLIGPSSVFVSGDDEAAKDAVKRLLHDLGWSDEAIVDLGGVTTARGPEAHILLFFETIAVLKDPMFNIHVVR